MATFNRLIKISDNNYSSDKSHPLFNKYSANFAMFEGSLSKEIKENESVDIILLPNMQLYAKLSNGTEHFFG